MGVVDPLEMVQVGQDQHERLALFLPSAERQVQLLVQRLPVRHAGQGIGAGLATRVIELKPDGSFADFTGSYDEYLDAQGLES